MAEQPISASDRHPRKQIAVLDSKMSYVDTGGSGSPMVFLHGNPTWSYLWRNIIEPLKAKARCLAPDLIGMGHSGKNPSGSYRFVDHSRYLDAWIDSVKLESKVTLVVHDWGSALGFNWARRNLDRVKAIAYMEAIVKPLTWDQWPNAAAGIFKAMRSPAGEEMVLQKNVFAERILPASIQRKLSPEEMSAYLEPWLQPGESRRPMLTWPREIPIDGEPAEVVAIVDAYGKWLAGSQIPKLFVNAEPGTILAGAQREFCRKWPNQREVTVAGLHFIQEDSPAAIADAIGKWYATL